MGKKQHSKDRMFITQSEWKNQYGGKKEATEEEKQVLPFNCCCISFSPVVEGMMTNDGYLFEKKTIYKYIKNNHMNPCTGEKLALKDLFPVHFFKNAEGEYHCPVTYKVFTLYSKIAVIRTSGNVYLYDCIKDLNIGQKIWTDLITGEPFTRDDIIILQDPSQPDHRVITKFYHVIKDEEEKKKNKNINVKISSSLQRMVDDIKEKAEQRRKEEAERKEKDALSRPRSLQTSKSFSSSFTSSAITLDSKFDYASDEEIEKRRYDRMRRMKKKGYVQIVTNMGTVNLEIHCDLVPKTAENFLTLCSNGKYTNTVFHRLIKNFMIQGGDPTGTGTGGESMWGHPFKDEFHPTLSHKGLGIVSMANSGPDSNNSQFFITFKSAPHLDNRHSIFGRVVGGLDVLQEMEKVAVDDQDRPVRNIMIAKTIVIVNPYDELNELLRRELEIEKKKEQMELEAAQKTKKMPLMAIADSASQKRSTSSGGIGKYLDPTSDDNAVDEEQKKTILEQLEKQISDHSQNTSLPVKKQKSGGFGDFSSW